MATKIEVCKPADLTMIAAIASRELEEKVTQETNGQFVVFTFDNCSGFEMFKLGLCYQNLITQ